MPMQPNIRSQLILGTYTCPLASVGNLILTLGQKFSRMASLTMVYEPVIKACDAIIAATAIVNQLPLITSDADFKSIKELELIFLEK